MSLIMLFNTLLIYRLYTVIHLMYCTIFYIHTNFTDTECHQYTYSCIFESVFYMFLLEVKHFKHLYYNYIYNNIFISVNIYFIVFQEPSMKPG